MHENMSAIMYSEDRQRSNKPSYKRGVHMKTRTVLVADELDKAESAAKQRSFLLQRFASDISVLLECSTDLVFVHGINELIGKKLFSGDNRRKILASDAQKYAPVIHNFKRPGKLIVKLGWPTEEIVKLLSKNEDFEALVLGTRGLEGLERFFLGSVAEEVVRNVKRPAFILGPGAQREEFNLSEHKKLHFLVVTDLTKRCRGIETYAVSLAKRTGAKVTFFHSLAETLKTARQFVYLAGDVITSVDPIFEDIKKEASDNLQKKIDRLRSKGIDCNSVMELKNEDVTEGALQCANDAQLILMGHQTQGFIANTVLGSNLRNMIAKAKVPVVVVHS